MDNKKMVIMPEPIKHENTIPIVTGVGNINEKHVDDIEEVNDSEPT